METGSGPAEQGAAPPFDLLLRGGHVIDPASGSSARMDVALAEGRVACVQPDIPPARARKVVDASGLLVTPGLIDLHVHVFPGHFDIAVVADAHSFRSGVTTVVDTGSAGAANFARFTQEVVARSKTRVLAFLNVVDLGMGGDFEQDVARMRPELAAETARAYPEVIVGIKVAHYWASQPWDAAHPPWACVEAGVRAGEMCGLPVMADFHPRPPERSYADLLLEKLRPGDIHTHVFAQQFPIILDDGQVNPLLFQAQARGIRFDVGHGSYSFWFRNAVRAVEQGFRPDSISTDLHVHSINGLAVSLPHTLSKLLNMGLSLEEVIARATVAPARQIGRSELGTLTVGAEADVAVLQVRDGDFGFADCGKARMPGRQLLEAVLTLRRGEVVYDPQGLTMPPWHEAPPDYWGR